PVLAPVESEASTAAPAQQKVKTDVRMSPRFLIAFKAFITYEGRVMKNETLNVSVGGMKLKNPLDRDAEGTVEVLLMHNNQELNMTCKILKDEGSAVGASRLLIEKCNRLDILRNWILSGNHKVS
ncbi:MAG: PilZ domain-containing protein, partial [Bdellovibrionota bacterium]